MSAAVKKVKLGIIGAGGRMGQEILKSIKKQNKFEPWVGVDENTKDTGFTHCVANLSSEAISKVDLWIDFSTPKALMFHLPNLLKTNKPLISGTTGFNDDQFKKLRKIGKQVPIFWSSNMSIGIAVANRMAKELSTLGDFDFQIEEIHHKKKMDSPSGTALTLQKNLEMNLGKKIPSPISIRGGGVFGIHRILALGENEILTIEHSALNRNGFAEGALWIAERLSKKPAGFYEMGDFLN